MNANITSQLFAFYYTLELLITTLCINFVKHLFVRLYHMACYQIWYNAADGEKRMSSLIQMTLIFGACEQ